MFTSRHSGVYIHKLLTQLTEEEQFGMWFQQYSATAHTADNSLMTLEGVLGDRTISRGLWQEHFLDFTPCDLYLLDNLKDKVYRTNLTPKKC
jgi:hypothetical protein